MFAPLSSTDAAHRPDEVITPLVPALSSPLLLPAQDMLMDEEAAELAELVHSEGDPAAADIVSRELRTVTLYIHAMQWAMFTALFALLLSLSFAYAQTWNRSCDKPLKMWSMVWLTRALLQCGNNIAATRLRLAGRRLPLALALFIRLLHIVTYIWMSFGVYVILYVPKCPGKATLALIVCKILFWMTVSLILLPLLLYALVLLCLPVLIYFMVLFAVRPRDRQPTPPEVVTQLKVEKYGKMVDSLRERYS